MQVGLDSGRGRQGLEMGELEFGVMEFGPGGEQQKQLVEQMDGRVVHYACGSFETLSSEGVVLTLALQTTAAAEVGDRAL